MTKPVRFAVCLVVAAIFVLPLYAMVVVSFTPRERKIGRASCRERVLWYV